MIMKAMKLILMSTAFAAVAILGGCKGNQQNEEMGAEQSQNLSQMEEDQPKMENEQDMHRQHESIRDNFAHRDIIILDDPYQAGAAANLQLKEVVNAYLEMKNALVKDNLSAADKAAAEMAGKVEAVDGRLLKGDGKKAWEQHASLYTSKLAEMQHVKDIEEKRSYFSHISEIVYCTVKSYALKDDMELYATYCPMAFDGKGAYWISETKEIKNPYFGAKMVNCGSVEEEL
jgi:flagellum-specific peptidoglycan hydrolase FlgJ